MIMIGCYVLAHAIHIYIYMYIYIYIYHVHCCCPWLCVARVVWYGSMEHTNGANTHICGLPRTTTAHMQSIARADSHGINSSTTIKHGFGVNASPVLSRFKREVCQAAIADQRSLPHLHSKTSAPNLLLQNSYGVLCTEGT